MTCEIRVRGELGVGWSAWFGGLTVVRAGGGETVLRGALADQPALHGLLRRIGDLGLPLISVHVLDD